MPAGTETPTPLGVLSEIYHAREDEDATLCLDFLEDSGRNSLK